MDYEDEYETWYGGTVKSLKHDFFFIRYDTG